MSNKITFDLDNPKEEKKLRRFIKDCAIRMNIQIPNDIYKFLKSKIKMLEEDKKEEMRLLFRAYEERTENKSYEAFKEFWIENNEKMFSINHSTNGYKVLMR